MDILLIVFLFLVAWLGGHLLDKLFSATEKFIQANVGHPQDFDNLLPTQPAQKICTKDNQPARLYVVPSATVRH